MIELYKTATSYNPHPPSQSLSLALDFRTAYLHLLSLILLSSWLTSLFCDTCRIITTTNISLKNSFLIHQFLTAPFHKEMFANGTFWLIFAAHAMAKFIFHCKISGSHAPTRSLFYCSCNSLRDNFRCTESLDLSLVGNTCSENCWYRLKHFVSWWHICWRSANLNVWFNHICILQTT